MTISKEFNLLDKIKYIFSSPNLFFEQLNAEKGIIKALGIFLLLGFFFNLFIFIILSDLFNSNITSLGIIIWVIWEIVLLTPLKLGFIFLGTGSSYLALKCFNKEATYSKTFQILVYSAVPPSLILLVNLVINSFGLILIINILIFFAALIYFAFLAVIGFIQLYKISKWKAVVVILALSPFVVLIIGIYLFLIGYSLAG